MSTVPFIIAGPARASFSGFGAERTQVTRDQWVANTNNAWDAANPGKAADFRANLGAGTGLLAAGGVSALVAIWAFATGKTGLGIGAAVVGLGLGGAGFKMSKPTLDAYGDTDPFSVGQMPGVSNLR